MSKDKNMNRKGLINVIKAIKPGLTKKDNTVELSEFVSFNDNEVVSYNSEISISYPYETGFMGSVKGDALLNILQKMPDDIKIEIKKEKLVITKKGKNKITASLNLLPVQTNIWPEIPEEFEPLPDNIIEAIKFCLFSVSPDPAMGALNCILLDQHGVVSCDNFRATHYSLELLDKEDDRKLLIPLNLAKILINYNIIKYAENDSWLFFEDDQGAIICCRKVEYEYPVKQVYGLFKSKGERINLPDDFKSVLDRSEILSQIDIENQKIVKMEILKNKLIISSSGDVGAYKEEIKLDYTGEDITILVNPVHMKHILNDCSEFILTESNISFKTDTFNHIIALISNE
jgi:DNA polymerase III sliding clamp (beta) subunit (PCNA family)